MKLIKRFRFWIFLALLIIPVLLRGLWFYSGFPAQPVLKSPDFASNTIPQPPISTFAPEDLTTSTGKVVVVDFMHSNTFVPSEIDTFITALTRRGARVEILNGEPSLATRLKYASAYVVFSPNFAFSVEEVNLVRNFVSSGGRLIVFTDPTRGSSGYDVNTGEYIDLPDSDAANNLLAPFGMTVKNDYLYNLVKSEGNFRNVLFDTFSSNAITSGLNLVAFYGVHSIQAENGTALVTGDANTYSSLTDSAGSGLAAAALSPDGNVLALGDFSFLIPPYDTVADNQILIRNLADYALGGTRAHLVADFPYVFDRTVYVVPTGELQITTDLLTPFAGLQNSLLPTNTALVMRATAPAEGDLLVIGSLTPTADLLPYINSFHLGLDDPATIIIPDFGTVNRSGVGLLLYKHTPERNTLILLTDLPEDLPTLINLLSSGYLSACVTQEDIGVCSIGFGDSTYFEPTWEPYPILEPTSTPSG